MDNSKKEGITEKTKKALKELNQFAGTGKPHTQITLNGSTNIIADDVDITILEECDELKKEVESLREIIRAKDQIIATQDAYIKRLEEK